MLNAAPDHHAVQQRGQEEVRLGDGQGGLLRGAGRAVPPEEEGGGEGEEEEAQVQEGLQVRLALHEVSSVVVLGADVDHSEAAGEADEDHLEALYDEDAKVRSTNQIRYTLWLEIDTLHQRKICTYSTLKAI